MDKAGIYRGGPTAHCHMSLIQRPFSVGGHNRKFAFGYRRFRFEAERRDEQLAAEEEFMVVPRQVVSHGLDRRLQRTSLVAGLGVSSAICWVTAHAWDYGTHVLPILPLLMLGILVTQSCCTPCWLHFRKFPHHATHAQLASPVTPSNSGMDTTLLT